MEVIKPYTTYKDSGIAWLGEIPEHWEIKKARNIGEFNGSTVDKKIDESQQKVRLVNFLDVYNNPKFEIHEKPFMVVTAKDEQIKKFRVNIGDVVFTPSSEVREDIGRSAVIKYEANDLVHSYHVIRLKFKENLDINFKKYLFNNYFVLKYFSKVCTGSTRKILTRQNFNNIELAIPTLPEQTAIANFLDYKTAKIDRFIFKKKQLIKLLNEQKAAIINDAVTKGQNPNAKMKPSGIEWLGEIPEHWEVRKIKSLGNAIIGLTYSPLELTDEGKGTLVLRSSNVQNAKITYDDCVYVTTKIPEKKRTIKGDILICSRNGSVRLIGKNAIIDEKASGQSFGAFMTIFRSSYFEYLHYFFNSASFKAQSGLFSTSTINQLTTGILNNILVAIPLDIKEQKLVVSHIEKETSIINKTIATIEKEIALVQEYRTALIAEAVTGKIDVREYNVPSFEEDKEYVELEEEMGLVAEEEINLD